MDCGGFAVIGSRPPSALSSHRPGSAMEKRHGYHTVSRQSSVDESLFRSQHPTKINEFINFRAPWDYPKPCPPRNTFGTPLKAKHDQLGKKDPDNKPRGRPLFWSPSPGISQFKYEKKTTHNSCDQWNTRGKFHQLRHTPTFVDETLFGNGLNEPTFVAPWNEKKKGEKKTPRPYLWDPSGGVEVDRHGGKELGVKGSNRPRKRPASALGLSRVSSSKSKGGPMPVWRP